jgi:hypothetical protein
VVSPPDPESSGFATWTPTTAPGQTAYRFGEPIEFAQPPPAPPVVVPAAGPLGRSVDLIAHWYNDFGKQATALRADQANGWWGWYDWQWNFDTNTGDGVDDFSYDPSRYPLPGLYAGDDAPTLDWQCHWLAASGIRAVNLGTAVFTSTGWESPTHPNHWMHQLFTAVPTFRSLRYVLGLAFDGQADRVSAQFDEVVSAYASYPGGYTHEHDGATYAVVFCWHLETLRRALDGDQGAARTRWLLRDLARRFRAIGYDGVCVLARWGGVLRSPPGPRARDAGLLILTADYEARYGSDEAYDHSYARYAATVHFPTRPRVVPNVVTAAESVHPHPSAWTLRGSTPELFEQALRRGVESASASGQRMLTIYNVSEWAEAGPGLLPQRRDRFGYLEAVRRVVTS